MVILSSNNQVHSDTVEKKDKDRREGKGRRGGLGHVLECRTNHLATRMI